MKSAVYEGIAKITIKEVPNPVCSKNNIVIRVKSCAICGTDVRTYHHGNSRVRPPQILGHEVAGEIVGIGSEVRGYAIGDRVSVAAIISCGTCYYCVRGLQNLCQTLMALGYEHPGGFAEYMAVPVPMLYDGSVNKIPSNLSFDEAAVVEPFACAVNGQELSQVKLGDKVVIIGAGPMGCMHIELAKIKGASKIIVIELSEKRLAMAKQFSADVYINPSEEDMVQRVLKETDGRGADVIIIAAPSVRAQEDALKMITYHGRINLFGGLPKDKPYINLDSNIVHYKEVFVHGTSGSLPRHNQIGLELFVSGRIDTKKFITHKLPLEKIVEGIKIVESGEGLKVVINP